MKTDDFSDEWGELPRPPTGTEVKFIDELKNAPGHERQRLGTRKPEKNEVSLAAGVRLEVRFGDARGLLKTAYQDFRSFLESIDLKDDGNYPIVVEQVPTRVREEFQVRITPNHCKLGANDTEGIRRGLIWIEDEILRAGSPCLRMGRFMRTPVMRTRISRCFYGPINRPPKLRDELADDVDYYPEAYLNRLAHDGVNALWLTIDFFRTVPSKIIPEYGRDSARRLEKLRWTVRKCERYGIRIYPFCIEPAAFDRPDPELAAAAKAHPELRGHHDAFCTSTAKGRAYVEEATRTLFSEVPRLGGLMVIPVGERHTHCYSSSFTAGGCPRCFS